MVAAAAAAAAPAAGAAGAAGGAAGAAGAGAAGAGSAGLGLASGAASILSSIKGNYSKQNQTKKGYEQVSGSSQTMTDEERAQLSNLVMSLVGGVSGQDGLGGLLSALTQGGAGLQSQMSEIIAGREKLARQNMNNQLEQYAANTATGTGSTFNTLMQAMQGRAMSEAETQLQGQMAELTANLQQQAFQQQQQAAATTSDVLTQLLNVLQGASREYNQTTIGNKKTTASGFTLDK